MATYIRKNGQLFKVGGYTASSGHTIENPSGTDMTQRANMQFVDAGVSDDSVNNRTEIEIVQEIASESDLTSAPDGVYQGAWDEDPSDVLTADMVGYGSGTVEDKLNALGGQLLASVTADGVKTNGALLNELKNAVDLSKVTNRSVLTRDTAVYVLSNKTSTDLVYSNFIVYGSFVHMNTFHVVATNSAFYRENLPGGTIDDYSSSIPSAGLVYAIYA